MQAKDHLALGHFLLNAFPGKGFHRHKYAFLLGCVEPDYNMVTYTRGMTGHRKFRGHNAENSQAHIEKCISGFQAHGLRSGWDYFTLGTLLHYTADAFTWPHNEFWGKSLVRHAAYERRLHEAFTHELRAGNLKAEKAQEDSLQAFLESSHTRYCGAQHGLQTDCSFIISTCAAMLEGCLHYEAEPAEKAIVLRKADFNEGAYHHGLV